MILNREESPSGQGSKGDVHKDNETKKNAEMAILYQVQTLTHFLELSVFYDALRGNFPYNEATELTLEYYRGKQICYFYHISKSDGDTWET